MKHRRRILLAIGLFYFIGSFLLERPYPFAGDHAVVWEIVFMLAAVSCFAAAIAPDVLAIRAASAFLVTGAAASRAIGFTAEFGLYLAGFTWVYVTLLQLLLWPYILPLTADAREVLEQRDDDDPR